MRRKCDLNDEHRYTRDAQCFSTMRAIAYKLGYNLVMHGSRGPKDLDLIAIPWTEKAVSNLKLIKALVKKTPLWRGERISEKEEVVPNKPHGRYATILIRPNDHRHIDLSVMPRIK